MRGDGGGGAKQRPARWLRVANYVVALPSYLNTYFMISPARLKTSVSAWTEGGGTEHFSQQNGSFFPAKRNIFPSNLLLIYLLNWVYLSSNWREREKVQLALG